MTLSRQAFIAVAVMVLAGCPGVQPQYKLGHAPFRLALSAKQLTAQEAIERADSIIVGEVRGKRLLDQTQTTDKGFRVRVWEINLRVICQVKGALPDTVSFYFYNYDPLVGAQNGSFEYRHTTGERGVFFLRHEGSMVRSVTDLYRITLPFPRSTCPDISRYRDRPMAEQIARLLLMPVEDLGTAQEFTQALPESVPDALAVAGYALVNSVVRELAKAPDPKIRRAACLAAYEWLFAAPSCLVETEKAGPDTATRARLQRDRERRDYLRRIAGEALRSGGACPLASYAPKLGWGIDPNGEVNLFQFLATNDDPVFRNCGKLELSRLKATRE